MKLPINREEALEWLRSMPQQESDMNHYLETEAIMRALARYFSEDEDYWGTLGLLHDVDWAYTCDDWSEHCIKATTMLEQKGFDEKFIRIVQSHAYGHDIIPALKENSRASRIEHCLVAAETLTGIIYAYALMRDGRISDMKAKGLKKKFKDKAFAANCNRELIREIEETGMPLADFFTLSIQAIAEIRQEIGLR